jgi:hypothetical protein
VGDSLEVALWLAGERGKPRGRDGGIAVHIGTERARTIRAESQDAFYGAMDAARALGDNPRTRDRLSAISASMPYP